MKNNDKSTLVGACTRLVWFRVEVTDLWRDCGGWSANCSWVRRYSVPVAEGASRVEASRKLKAAAGIQGMRADGWAGSSYSWRDGCVGAWAEIDHRF
jgi:hypothetical protein